MSSAESPINVIVTKTDRDFVSLTVGTSGKDGKQVALGKLTTTFHHPFYDITQAAFVDAQHLKPGDKLQTVQATKTGTPASGTGATRDGPISTVTVLAVHLYHADTVTYDLTIGDLHTYYVEAGTTPVPVHNYGGGNPDHADSCRCGTGGPTRSAVEPGEVGSFKDLNSRSRVGDGLTPDHIPQAASGRLPDRGDYASVMLTDAEHALTRDFEGAGIRTKRIDASLTFRQVVAAKLWNYRSIGQQLYNDPSYFNEQISGVLNFYRTNYSGLLDRPAPGATGEWGR